MQQTTSLLTQFYTMIAYCPILSTSAYQGMMARNNWFIEIAFRGEVVQTVTLSMKKTKSNLINYQLPYIKTFLKRAKS